MPPVLRYIGKQLLLFCLLGIANTLGAQMATPVYLNARKIIDTLTSPAMHGRGYTNNGDKIAASYISGFFKKLNLSSWNNTYYQRFTFSINTFPPSKNTNSFFSLSFTDINNQHYTFDKPGVDYILSSTSPSFRIKETDLNTVIWIDSTALSEKDRYGNLLITDFTNKLVVVDDKGITNGAKIQLAQLHQNATKAQAWIVLNHKKLTASVSTTVSSLPEVEVLVAKTIYRNELKDIHIEGSYHNDFEKSYTSKNICGYIPGSQEPDSFIVFTAHYDHLGEMGNTVYFPGANDNASGTAMLLTLMDYYSKPENKPRYSIAFISFAGEEPGLLGSEYYTEHPLFPLNKIKFLINMDLLGTGEEGITVVNGSEYKAAFEKLIRINMTYHYLTQIKSRGKAANSDHYFFSENNVPCFFIYTMGGIKAYHDIYDVSKTLPLTKFEDITNLLIKFVE